MSMCFCYSQEQFSNGFHQTIVSYANYVLDNKLLLGGIIVNIVLIKYRKSVINNVDSRRNGQLASSSYFLLHKYIHILFTLVRYAIQTIFFSIVTTTCFLKHKFCDIFLFIICLQPVEIFKQFSIYGLIEKEY